MTLVLVNTSYILPEGDHPLLFMFPLHHYSKSLDKDYNSCFQYLKQLLMKSFPLSFCSTVEAMLKDLCH